jgi:hypothetical protein
LLFENCIELEGVQDNFGGEGLFPIIIGLLLLGILGKCGCADPELCD